MNAGTDKAKTAPRMISDYRLAILAAIMGKPPADALRLWWQSKSLLKSIEAESDGEVKQGGMDFFAENEKGVAPVEMFEWARLHKRIPWADALNQIGLKTEKALCKLLSQYRASKLNPFGKEALGADEIKESLQDYKEDGFPQYLVTHLQYLRRNQTSQRGRMNRLAVKNVKG